MPREKPVETIIRPRVAPEVDQSSETDSISKLQEQMDELREEMKSLQAEFARFKSQFD
jgi:molecular chaperone GrpE (heat shock protein)